MHVLTGNRWKAIGMLLLAALVGAAVGSLVVRRGGPWGGGGPHRWSPQGYARLLDRELDLTPAQRDSVENILRTSTVTLDSLWREMQPRFDSLRMDIRGRIRAQLNPEQQSKYGRLTDRLDAERRKHAESGHR